MKTTCDFCKTEYTLNAQPTAPVQCALCGNIWTVAPPRRRNSFLVLVAAVCALLAATVFALAIVAHQRASRIKNDPLVAQISEIHTVVDAFGAAHFVVSGRVANRSAEIYGVPDLLIVSRDAAGNIIAQQKFMPSATLLDAGDSAVFSHTLSAPTTGVKKVTVELRDN
ncbi:MAG: zinc-ribbon domain-containing protein [Rickettsiales bacterium]|jgi:hypothetical protein|nr:zinc-ribbon domain-containing protein [Rickettsiales bacterium]